MSTATEFLKSESDQIDDHIITVEALFHSYSNRWEPIVTVAPSWQSEEVVKVATTEEHFQDTPQDALAVARDLARQWLVNNDPRSGTVDAAV